MKPLLGATRFHFIGAGGIGMSGLAQLLCERGLVVSGSDVSDSPRFGRLRALGATIHLGHAAEHIGDAEQIVFSTAIDAENSELQAAQARGLSLLHRSQLLAALMEGRRDIAVSGTHGKSTTTAMIARILLATGRDPSIMVGAEMRELADAHLPRGNARSGRGDWFVAEADESDGSFLRCAAEIALVTNIECDHMDYWREESRLTAAFQQFVDGTRPGGRVVLCADDANARALQGPEGVEMTTYGNSDSAEFRVGDYSANASGCTFRLMRGAKVIASLRLKIWGAHNALNASAALLAAQRAGVAFDAAAHALEDFGGLHRRMEIIGQRQEVTVVDDYAHHPTEVAATLQAARERWPHVVAVFQPHRFTRTRDRAGEFGGAFVAADEVILTEVYAVHEQPIAGVSGRLIADAVSATGQSARFLPTQEEARAEVQRVMRPGGAVLFLGAGDITSWASAFVSGETNA